MAARTLSATRAHAVAVRAEHAELHREADGRSEVQPVDPEARLGDHVLGDEPFEPRLQPLARLRVLGHHHDEREALVRQHGVQGQEEARRAFADVGRVVLEIGIALDEGFGLLGGGFRDADGCSLRHADLDEELRPRRVGKNCCWTCVKAAMAAPKAASVNAMTTQRKRTDQPTTRRSAR